MRRFFLVGADDQLFVTVSLYRERCREGVARGDRPDRGDINPLSGQSSKLLAGPLTCLFKFHFAESIAYLFILALY